MANPGDLLALLREAVDEAGGNVNAVLRLAELVERTAGAKLNAGARACSAAFARDLREAVASFRSSQDLLAYRRDWGNRQWHEWLDQASQIAGTVLRSVLLPQLRDAGCSQPGSLLQEWTAARGARMRETRPGSIPAADQVEAWLGIIRLHEAEFNRAVDAADVEHWLICRGFDGDAHEWLQLRKPRLPAHLRPLIADYVPPPAGKERPFE